MAGLQSSMWHRQPHRCVQARLGLLLAVVCLLMTGVVGIRAVSVPHSVAVDPDMDEVALAALLAQPHPVQRSSFEALAAEISNASASAGKWAAGHAMAGRKLQEQVLEMKHWTEEAYGIPYRKNAEKWLDPVADSDKPLQWGSSSDPEQGELPAQSAELTERHAHEDRLVEAAAKRRSLLFRGKRSLGLAARGNMGPSPASLNGSLFRWDSILVPASVDWRVTNAITVVKTQGQCASCWALAAADTISMMWAIQLGLGRLRFDPLRLATHGDPQFEAWGRLDVSAQEVCDCGLGTCCQGGWPEWAFQYVMANGGVSAWQRYPYFQMDNTCNPNLKQGIQAQISGWEMVPTRSPDAARKAVAQQPFLAFISASSPSFQKYLGGYYDAEDCGEQLDHVVVVVGYGNSDKGPYWIIKNSWGANWGVDGYMFLAAKPGKGHCGIHAAPGLYPTYFPLNVDPCLSFPNPCGSGTCYTVTTGSWLRGTLSRRVRCGCPAGFVENNQTNPAKCVGANPCGANPNPCGSGACNNLKDGTYSCACPEGHKTGSQTNGAPTCVPDNRQGGASTVTVVEGTSIQDVVKGYNLTTERLVQLNPWVDPTVPLPTGAVLAISAANATFGCVRLYIVQANETCESIAGATRVSVGQLQRENPLASCANLIPGTELCLERSFLADTKNSIPPECGQLYEVQEGDTCASVKMTARLEDETFAKLNEGVNCSRKLAPGMILCTAEGTGPDPNCTKFYTVQHGDTCVTIWLMANLTQSQFFLLNQGFRCYYPYLQVGQQVCIKSSSSSTADYTNLIPYVVQSGDTLTSISQSYTHRCGQNASVSNICVENRLFNCSDPPPGTLLKIPCTTLVGRSCDCTTDRDPYYGADGKWYNNYCEAVCNYALPAAKQETFCKNACKDRAGLTPYNDPSSRCSRPCPWPQWNPQPQNWWWFSNTFSKYYIGACQDWCSASASTVSRVRDDWGNWSRYYNDCVAACRYGKC